MKFVDLFAGLGGFHVALKRLGHRCAFASEIEPGLQELYKKNFGLEAKGDIRQVPLTCVPAHDILCAGFPCQPFSKAGSQEGLKCPRNGDLFDYVMQVLRLRKPKYLILENVPNLARHESGATWKTMRHRLRYAGYDTREHRFSPHQFGIPQVRDRIYIVGSVDGLDDFEWPAESPNPEMSIVDALEDHPKDAKLIPEYVIKCLNVWQKFVKRFPKKKHLPTFPIWSMEFGATYPYIDETPHAVGVKRLGHYRGSHGVKLSQFEFEERMQHLPSHARTEEDEFPDWKIQFIRQNRALYSDNRDWIDAWMPELLTFPSSLQKLEWNCKGGERDIWSYVVQFRASGVRIKKPSSSPSLVAMTTTQVPIIGWQKRYMTPRECAHLQSLGELKHLPPTPHRTMRARLFADGARGDFKRRVVMPVFHSENQTSRDCVGTIIDGMPDAWPLPSDVRRFSELVIDGSDPSCKRALEILAGLPSIKAAYLIALSVTHPERILGIDDLGCLASALDRRINTDGNVAS